MARAALAAILFLICGEWAFGAGPTDEWPLTSSLSDLTANSIDFIEVAILAIGIIAPQ